MIWQAIRHGDLMGFGVCTILLLLLPGIFCNVRLLISRLSQVSQFVPAALNRNSGLSVIGALVSAATPALASSANPSRNRNSPAPDCARPAGCPRSLRG